MRNSPRAQGQGHRRWSSQGNRNMPERSALVRKAGQAVVVRKDLFLIFLFLGLGAFIPVSSAEDSKQDALRLVSDAIDVQQDLALMPSGVLVSLKTGQVLDQTRLFTKFEGNNSAGCGVLRNGHPGDVRPISSQNSVRRHPERRL